MHRLKPGVDIVLDILKIVAEKQSGNQFSQSILMQYQERGGLSKKQLEGLYGKAKRIPEISQNKVVNNVVNNSYKKPISNAPKTGDFGNGTGYTGLAALAAGLMLLLGIKKKRKEEDGEE